MPVSGARQNYETRQSDGAHPRASPARTWLLLGAVLFIAGAVRIWGIDWGLPYVYHPDEPTNLTRVMVMLETGDPNPHWFHYGSLIFYLNAAALGVVSVLREIFGAVGLGGAKPPAMIALASGVTSEWWTLVVPRAMTIAAGIGATAIIFQTVLRVTRRHLAAAFSGLLFAMSPLAAAEGRTFTPDTYTALFAAAAIFYSVRVYEQGLLRDYVLAGTMVGLAVGSKYNAALVGVVVIAAHVMRQRGGLAAPSRSLLVAFCSALAAFVITTPFAILDAGRFLADLGFELVHYSSGHVGFEAGPTVYVTALAVSFSVGLLLVPFAFTNSRTRIPATIVGVYALTYLGAISLFRTTFARNLMPVLPAIAMVVGLGLHGALTRFQEHRRPVRTAIYTLCVVTLVVASTALTFQYSSLEDREPARAWIEENVEPGATVVTESYSPWIDGDQVDLRAVSYVVTVDPTAEWDYLLITHRGSGRFDMDPRRYQEHAAALDSIRDHSCLEATFPGVVEIRSRHCS